MDQNESSVPKALPVIPCLIFLVLGLVIGMGISLSYIKSTVKKEVSTVIPSVQSVLPAAEQDSVLASLQGALVAHTLSGTVTAINGNAISINVSSANASSSNGSATNRTAIVANDTIITIRTLKNAEFFTNETKAFNAEQMRGTDKTKFVPAPLPYTSKAGAIGDILIGSVIDIGSKQDITTAKEFTAAEIIMQKATQ